MFEGQLVSPPLRGDPSKRFSFVEPGIFQAIGVISFAFVCHHNSLLIYGSLRTPTLDRFATVTHVSTVVSLIACSIMAISGYVVFTDRTQGNILNNFSPVSPPPPLCHVFPIDPNVPENDTLINIARLCFGLNMFTTLPLELFVCREVTSFSLRRSQNTTLTEPRTGSRAVFFLARIFQHAATRFLHHRDSCLRHDRCAQTMLPLISTAIHKLTLTDKQYRSLRAISASHSRSLAVCPPPRLPTSSRRRAF